MIAYLPTYLSGLLTYLLTYQVPSIKPRNSALITIAAVVITIAVVSILDGR